MKENHKISSKIVGKKIVKICFDENGWKAENDEEDLEVDEGNIYLVLDDGTILKVWNSEWGGICILKGDTFFKRNEVEEVKECGKNEK